MVAPGNSSTCWGEFECVRSFSAIALPTSLVSITVAFFGPLKDLLLTFSLQLTRRHGVVAYGRHPLGHTLRSPAWQGWALPVSVSPEPTDAEGGGGG